MKLYIVLTIVLYIFAPNVYAEHLTPLEQIIRKSRPRLDSIVVSKIAISIITESKVNGLNPDLVAAVIWAESGFLPSATGAKGEVGLMQIQYEIWKNSPILKGVGVDNRDKLYWVDLNIASGTKILVKYLEYAKDDIVRALYRYNSGRTRLPKGIPRYKIPYVNKVLIKMYEIAEQTRKK